MPSSHLILCCPLLRLPSIPPSIRVFSNESTLHMRWPKYWSFSFSVSPSNEHPGLVSFRMDCLDLLAVQGTLKSFLHHHSSKASIVTINLRFKKNQYKRPGFSPWVPTPVFLPGESHGQRSLVDYGWWGHKESEPAERLTLFTYRNICKFCTLSPVGLIYNVVKNDLSVSHTHSYFLLSSLSLPLVFKFCPWSLPYHPIDTYSESNAEF